MAKETKVAEQPNYESQLDEMVGILDAEEAKKAKQDVDQIIEEELKAESREERYAREAREKLDSWIPKTELGKKVKTGKITDIDEVLNSGVAILEPEIVDLLIPSLRSDLLHIGQSKGKFGGGKRRAFRQTQKIKKEGSILSFSVMAVVGDGKGHLGIGYGRAAETLPAKEKALRKAKLNIQKILRGCASYDCSCDDPHSLPIATEGKSSSVRVKLMPAPQGTGLVVGDELKKILVLAGIKDVYGKSSGKVQTTFNTAKACVNALTKMEKLNL